MSGYNNIFKGIINGRNVFDSIRNWWNRSKVGSGVSSWLGGVTGSSLTPAEMAANEFSHNEAQLGRQFTEDFYNQYQSPQAMVRQYQEAGLNPGLMYGSGTGSSGTVSSSAPSSVTPSSSPLALLSVIPSLAKLKAEIDDVHASAALKRDQGALARANTFLTDLTSRTKPALDELEIQLRRQGVSLNEIDLAWKEKQYEQAYRRGEIDVEMARVGVARALKEIEQLSADTALTLNKVRTEELVHALTQAQTFLAHQNGKFVSLQAAEQAISNKIFSETGNKSGTNIWGLIPGIASRGNEVISDFVGRARSGVRGWFNNINSWVYKNFR